MVTTRDAVNSAYKGILKEQSNLEGLRNTLLTINQDINLFLLDPLNEDLIHKIDINTNNAINKLTALSESKHPFHKDLKAISERTSKNFYILKSKINILVKFRLDINKQYPGLDISANIMENQQNSIKSGFEILINEIESGDLQVKSPQIYPLLLKSYSVWISAISQTRIYMANRLASFSSDILDEQGNSLKDIYTLFTNNIKTLNRLYRHEDSFEANDILKSAITTSQSWYENFVTLREISESDKWRSDTLIIKTQVFPLVEQVVQNLNEIDKTLNDEKQNTDQELKKSDDQFNKLIFVIIALFMLFIAAILISMQWMVFTPIHKVTLALRSKAFDIDLPNIESSKTLEVGQLIDAFIEMDEEVTQRQNALEHQAMHDHLTGLPNRFLLNQRIEYQLLHSERQNTPFSMFLMDLDFFKDINDTLGHAAGDHLLIEVSQRIKNSIRKSDTLARLGGDEFAILLPETKKETASKLAESIIQKLSDTIDIDNQKVSIGISIGIVNYPDDGIDIETLLQHADMAMYTAKRERAGYVFYDSSQNTYSKARLSLNHDIIEALEHDQFDIYFQPKIDAVTQNLCGAEGLLRWKHKDYGFISPEKVIESAERAGVIHKLTLSMIEKAISACSQWHKSGHKISVAVNLSVRDLSNKDLTTKVKEFMDKYALEYHFLTLEITESIMMENLAISLEVLQKLNKLGVHISIDDFGTGFSSLAYLKKLPVNELKIDKSFIIEINQDANDKKIVSAIINLGHNLGLNVVAEGIETQKSMDMIKAMGCDQMQGYFISKPICKTSFQKYLENHEKNSNPNC
ncbi:putative bifunctional diguanylate cyclase/phosphodiesterase [Thiomicrorhabdus immobilis]|uniref:putative bifunctional diguanylate cyclase/phosphodiesterase n=1 Tax=Thiomicrorhabdus immobilis TaxID=2791037 RepID=UPI001F2E3813|nr:EAL domain-containing protein [Thiomicrorhabdus immobilis]